MSVNNNEVLDLIQVANKYVKLSIFNKKYTFNFVKSDNKGYKIIKNDHNVVIEYNKKNQIFAALLHIDVTEEKSYEYTSVNAFNDLGVMIDFARNATFNVEYAKKTIVQLALIGYDTFQLYLEDCFEVDNEEMFGYLRGSYTKEELKEIDRFGQMFGIEVVPSIQTLAHLNQIFRWPEYFAIKDIDDILLIKNERTHQLIENMIKTLRECFSTNRLNISMDEAHNLGRGRYLDKNGYEKAYNLFLEHKDFVVSICEKYNFKPMMWSDMFFRSLNNGKYYVGKDKIDFQGLHVKDTDLIFWDYYHTKQYDYENMIKVHKSICDNVVFAGAIWVWRGIVPHLRFTESSMIPGIRACKKHGINTVFFTLWGDDGNECLRGSALGSYIFLAEHSKVNKVEKELINKKCIALTGYSYKEWINLDRPNFIDLDDAYKYDVNPSKYLLYMDPLLSIYDNLIHPNYKEFYTRLTKYYHKMAKRNMEYSYLFELESKLCKVLSYKAPLSVSIKKAYEERNIEEIKQCLVDVEKSIILTIDLHNYYRTCWNRENKMTGFEVQDVRLGGLVARLQYVKHLLEEYISTGGIRIEELEIERKDFVSNKMTKNNETLVVAYGSIVSTNRLTW